MNPHALMQVMYGPLGYAHPDHRTIAGVALARVPADVANQWLIDHHRLDTAIDADWHSAPLARSCVDHWARLRRIAFLIGVQRLRAALVEHGRYVRLDPSSQRFLCMPLAAVPKAACASAPDDDAIVAAGAACIAAALRDAPRALHQRLPLLFPRAHAARLASELGGARDDARAAWSPTLFSFAMNHALLDPAPVS
ncbi:type III secretion apparatus protein OrgA/MxiK [Burkholderia mayonis]|uniref:Type III secretion system protein n=1 Tax=Burkholderia mayonis TaxID=1385591 RepID=A0A1B4G2K1_9BURK|nr:type III secretion apparatus protein OrgA/MxiK [Burkholderia mayonis]AOJ10149.1 type III secretion system protein [Burkholderia mayonis]KVE56254.1 type III secretion system protein [Burkholderia mayonis]